jgi:hypothetical protein
VFKALNNCIFCNSKLPNDRSNVGEHIFPKNIYGFWRSYDLCSECMQYFGDNVDNLSINNPHILRAIEYLKLPKLEEYLRNYKYHGEDVYNGRKVEMIRKYGVYQTKTIKNEDKYFECPEVIWELIGTEWIKQHTKHKVSKEDLDKEIEKLKNEYRSIKPGYTIKSELLGYTIRKTQINQVKPDDSTFKSITPLLAKIAVAFLYYFLPLKITLSIDQLDLLKDHAIGNAEIPEYFINPCSFSDEEYYEKNHAVSIHIEHYLLILDITFFGSIIWRILLNINKKFDFDEIDGVKYNDMMFYQDFRDQNDRKKIVLIKPIDDIKYIQYELKA